VPGYRSGMLEHNFSAYIFFITSKGVSERNQINSQNFRREALKITYLFDSHFETDAQNEHSPWVFLLHSKKEIKMTALATHHSSTKSGYSR
jgi:hypothetical protein